MTDRRAGRRWGDDLLKPCGTTAAYRRHYRRGEPIDESCRQAQAREAEDRRTRGPGTIELARAQQHATALNTVTTRHDAEILGTQLKVSWATIYRWRRLLRAAA